MTQLSCQAVTVHGHVRTAPALLNIFSLQSALESIFINTISIADDSCHVMAARQFYADAIHREVNEHRQKIMLAVRAPSSNRPDHMKRYKLVYKVSNYCNELVELCSCFCLRPWYKYPNGLPYTTPLHSTPLHLTP